MTEEIFQKANDLRAEIAWVEDDLNNLNKMLGQEKVMLNLSCAGGLVIRGTYDYFKVYSSDDFIKELIAIKKAKLERFVEEYKAL